MIKRMYYKAKNSIYMLQIGLIFIFIIMGYLATLFKTGEMKEICVAMAALGVLMGFGTVILSVVEAKKVQKFLIVVFDLFLVIVIYALVFSCIYSYNNDAFKLTENNIPYLDLLYYSFATFTTLGYGDIIPVSYIAKFLSVSEAFMFACVISLAVINFSDGMKKYMEVYKNEDK